MATYNPTFDRDRRGRFNPDANFTQVVAGSGAYIMEDEFNQMQMILNEARADLVRMQYNSGVIEYVGPISNLSASGMSVGQLGTYTIPNVFPNRVYTGTFQALVNGYRLSISGHESNNGLPNGSWNQITLPDPPAYGTRDDLVFLEVWFQEVSALAYAAGSTDGVIYKKGGVNSGNLGNDILDGRKVAETTRRVQLRWRIRAVAGVDFSTYPSDGFAAPSGRNPSVRAQGGNTSPASTSDLGLSCFALASGSPYINTTDTGLYFAGYGDQASKDTLKTIDGYVYAIPLFRVKRRNSGGYRADNLNGSRDFFRSAAYNNISVMPTPTTYTVSSADAAALQVGDLVTGTSGAVYGYITGISGTTLTMIYNPATTGGASLGAGYFQASSGRPDGLYSNLIDATDIVDLRRQTLVNPNYQATLDKGIDQLLQGQLTTWLPKTMQQENYGLSRAPLGLSQSLQSVRIKRSDGTFVDLTNLLGLSGKKAVVSNGTDPYEPIITSATLTSGQRYLLAYYVDSTDASTARNTPYLVQPDSNKVFQAAQSNYNASKGYKFWKFTATQGGSHAIKLWLQGYDQPIQYSRFALYELSAADYDAIDAMTSSQVEDRWPYTDGLNYVENLVPPFTDPAWTIHANAVVQEPYRLALTATAGQQSSTVSVKCSPNTVYTASVPSVPTGCTIWFDAYDQSGTRIGNITSLTPGSTTSTFTTGSTTQSIRVIVQNNVSPTTGTFSFLNIQVEKGAFANPFVPYGRWMLPANYQGNNAPVGSPAISRFAGVNGDTFNAQRSIFSDALTVDPRTDLVEALMTPQRHIKVTQATVGQWANGDKIQITSDYGVVTGLVDADTGVSTVVKSDGSATLTLDDVSKFAVNDTASVVHPDGSVYAVTISAIDTTNKTVTVGTAFSANWIGARVVETTSASSIPTVTAAGIAGTWSGLGTKTATYTISTAPTDNKATIKVDYSMVYPGGKGYSYVPETIFDGYVNGDRVAASNTVTIKANFAGKTAGSTDACPHTHGYAANGASIQPPNGSITEYSTAEYGYLRALDQYTTNTGKLSSGQWAQQLFSFDLIRAVEDKYGEIPANGTADKVAWVKANIGTISFDWYGSGSAPGNTNSYIKTWHVNASIWDNVRTSTTSTVSKLNIAFSGAAEMASRIDANGRVHFLAYADAADGTTVSTISTDYVELSITLNVAETGYTVLQPDNPFPAMAENLLTANQAFPVDTTSLVAYNGSISIDTSYGKNAVKLLHDQPSSPRCYAEVTGAAVKGRTYTASAYVRGQGNTIGKALTLFLYEYDGSSWLASASTITLTDGWQRVAASKQLNTLSNGAVRVELGWNESTGNTGNFAFIADLKLQEGTSPTTWTPGRNRVRTLNYLGKIAGSTVENPHRVRSYADSAYPVPTMAGEWSNQANYDNISKQDGTVQWNPASVSGQRIQYLFEFDFSHMGLSLKELKAALRGLAPTWVGYGSGDNAGALTYGATMEWWNPTTSGWVTMGGNTTSSPSNIAISYTNSDVAKYITNDQKMYILLHPDYAASASIASTLYTDYIKLDATLAEYVDYKKSNIVKVRPDTKEIKLVFPAHSYRYTGASSLAQADVVTLNYRYTPYQGIGTFPQNQVLAYKAFALTAGTGKSIPWLYYYGGATTRLPVQLPDYRYTGEAIKAGTRSFTTGEVFGDLRIVGGSLWDGTYVRTVSKGAFAGASAVRLYQVGGVTRGYGKGTIDGMDTVFFDRELSSAGGAILYVVAALIAIAGELTLAIITFHNAGDVWTYSAVDTFRLPGRPLVKGV